MAGNIQKLNLKTLESKYNTYRTKATNVYSNLENIQKSLVKLTNSWTGKRINMVIEIWNKQLLSLRNNVDYFGIKIDDILHEMLEQYTLMEMGRPSNVSYGTVRIQQIKDVPLTDSTTIKFASTAVKAHIKEVEAFSNNIESNISSIIKELDELQVYSDSLKSLVTNYKSVGNSMITDIKNVLKTISEESRKALNDVVVTEQYNENDAKRATNTSEK